MINMQTPHSPETINEADVKRLILQLEQDALSTDDKKLITKVLQSYLFVAGLTKETGIRLKAIRDFFGVGAKKQKHP